MTGQININTKFPQNDHRNYNLKGDYFDVGDTFSGVNFEKGLEAVTELKKILPSGYTLADLALKWILMHDAVSVVIPGAINKLQVMKNASSSKLDDISKLSEKIFSIYEKIIKPEVHHRW